MYCLEKKRFVRVNNLPAEERERMRVALENFKGITNSSGSEEELEYARLCEETDLLDAVSKKVTGVSI